MEPLKGGGGGVVSADRIVRLGGSGDQDFDDEPTFIPVTATSISESVIAAAREVLEVLVESPDVLRFVRELAENPSKRGPILALDLYDKAGNDVRRALAALDEMQARAQNAADDAR